MALKKKTIPTAKGRKKTVDPFAPKLNRDGSLTVLYQVASCNPETVQYKPYGTVFVPVPPAPVITITVPARWVVGLLDGHPLLLPEGALYISKQIAKASSLIHSLES